MMKIHSLSSVDGQPNPSDYIKAITSILDMLREGKTPDEDTHGCIPCFLETFLDDFNVPERFEKLIQSGVLETFVNFYSLDERWYRDRGENYIRCVLKLITDPALTTCLDERASVVLELCLSMGNKICNEDDLYILSVRALRDLVVKGKYLICFKFKKDTLSHVPYILRSLRFRLVRDLNFIDQSLPTKENTERFFGDFWDFKVLSRFLCQAIQQVFVCPIPENYYILDGKKDSRYEDFCILLTNMKQRLGKLYLTEDRKINERMLRHEWSLYLPILGELYLISKIYEGAEDIFWGVLKDKNVPIRALILRFTNRTEDYDYEWLLEHNDVTDSESRMHLALLMIPQVKLEPDMDLIQELVNWSCILDTDLSGDFKNKKLTDVQELQNWLCRSSEAIFSSKRNPLFLECQDNPNRFFINHEFKTEPFHYECVEVAGKVIALALIYKVRIGVEFDRRFLSELTEELNDSSLDKKVLVPFFAKGFADVFGVSIKELLSFRGLEFEDINQVLQRPSTCHHSARDTDLRAIREADLDPLLSQYQKVRRLGRDIKTWQKGEVLGSGSFGEVYKGLADHGFLFAAKKVPLLEPQKVKSVEHEIDLLCQLNHENIVEYFGTRKEDSELYIFLEFVNGGSLEKVYRQFSLDDFQVSRYTKQILQGLKYLHERNVMHGDIKCANVLLNKNGYVKIADFGLAKVTELRSLRKSGGGTPAWSAPEVINPERGGYGLEADIWSVGCTVLEMLTRKYPYYKLQNFAVKYRIGKGIPPSIPDTLSVDAQDFIQKCLQVDSKKRPTAAQLLDYPFIRMSS